MSLNMSPEDYKQMRKQLTILWLFYTVCGVLMAIAAVLSIIAAHNLLLAIYSFFFALLVCGLTCSFRPIRRYLVVNFGFLYSSIGRLLFAMVASFALYSLGIVGIVAMACLLGTSFWHLIVDCRYPTLEAWLKQRHFYQESLRDSDHQESESW